MKVLILFAFFAASQASVLLTHGIIGTGASQQYRNQDGLGNYAFGYNEGHANGATFRKEVGNAAGVVAGSYGLTAADGRHRVVNYIADAAGFRADVKTNEPGVEPKDPAATTINKAGILAAPAFAHAPILARPVAPLTRAQILAFPVAPLTRAPILAFPVPPLTRAQILAFRLPPLTRAQILGLV